MTVLNFPSSPVDGEVYPSAPSFGVNQFQWDEENQTWGLLGPLLNVTPGTYGDEEDIPQLTINAQGQVTFAENISIFFAKVVEPPTASIDPGNPGEVAMDSSYFYWYGDLTWQRVTADPTPW